MPDNFDAMSVDAGDYKWVDVLNLFGIPHYTNEHPVQTTEPRCFRLQQVTRPPDALEEGEDEADAEPNVILVAVVWPVDCKAPTVDEIIAKMWPA